MNFKQQKTQQGQVLLITLLVLTIIGIVIVGLVTLSNRDVTQVVTSEKYETLYNSAETEVRKIVDNFGRYDKVLDTLPTVFNTCTAVQTSISYHCTNVDTTTGNTNFKTDIDVTNKKDIQNFEIKKDRSFVVKLAGYAGVIDVSWDKPAAVEFSIIAQDSSRNLKVIKDVYDLAGVYDGLVGDNPYNQPNPNHQINYQVLDASNKPLGTRLNITNTGVNGLAASDYVYYLTITPRLKQDNSSVKFNVVAQNASAFPYQVREFISTSVDTNDSSSPLAKVITQIPLAPQMDSVFDYALISNSAINSY
ncbi:MAG: hypothetical protein ACMG57_02830 [Candidatus Dojkabacteria bacterium]